MKILKFLLQLFKAKEPENTIMKYLIVGLGNMHPDYSGTRHNIGFDVVDYLAEEKEVDFKNDQLGDLAEVKHRGRTLILLKPSTYMNRSGKSVRYWMQKKKIKPENLLVIVDDTNLPFGKLRIRGKGSDGGHNGLKDIQNMLSSQQYARLRVGIGSDYPKGGKVNFVLGRWSDEELDQLEPILKKSNDIIKSFSLAGLQHTMTDYNK